MKKTTISILTLLTLGCHSPAQTAGGISVSSPSTGDYVPVLRQDSNGNWNYRAVSGTSIASYSAPEAALFVMTNGITDPSAQAALVGMETELKKFGVWGNVLDVVPFYPRFNPLSGNTFFGRTFTNRDFQFGNWGVSNFPSPVEIGGFPYMTNGSILVVYGKAPLVVNALACSIAGWFNPNGGHTNEYFLKSTAASYDGLVAVTNNTTWVPGGVTGDYPNSYLYTPMGTDGASTGFTVSGTSSGPPSMGTDQLVARADLFSFNTNGTVAHWRNGVQSEFAQSGTYSPLLPFTNLTGYSSVFIGKDPAGQYPAPQQQIAAVFVFNCEITTNLAFAVTRAARWLDPAQNDIVLIGDSRMFPNGVNSFDGGLRTDAAANNSYIYNWAGSGQTANQYSNSLATGGRISTVLSMLSKIGCVQKNNLFYGLGVNDMGGGAFTPAYTFGALCYFCSNTPPDYNFIAGTIYPYATNGTAAGYVAPGLVISNIVTYNGLIYSNANIFSGGYVDQFLAVSPYMQVTNAANSIDGLHFYGTYGYVINSKLAQSWTRFNTNNFRSYP